MAAVVDEGDRPHPVLGQLHLAQLGRCRQIPQPRRSIRAAREQARAVRMVSECKNRLRVALERRDQCAVGDAPDLDRSPFAPHRQRLPVRREDDRAHLITGVDAALLAPRRHVPDPHQLSAGPHQALAIARETQPKDRVRVVREAMKLLPTSRVPQHGRALHVPRCHQQAIRRNRHRRRPILMPRKSADLATADDVPNPRRVVPTRRGEKLAIAGEGEGADGMPVAEVMRPQASDRALRHFIGLNRGRQCDDRDDPY